MTIVIVFVFLNIPRVILGVFEVSTIPNILECRRRHCRYFISPGRWVADSIIRFLLMLNSSLNFIIYCFHGSTFRRTLFSIIHSICTSGSQGEAEDANSIGVVDQTHAPDTTATEDVDGQNENEISVTGLQISRC